jgi:hypothetical protein
MGLTGTLRVRSSPCGRPTHTRLCAGLARSGPHNLPSHGIWTHAQSHRSLQPHCNSVIGADAATDTVSLALIYRSTFVEHFVDTIGWYVVNCRGWSRSTKRVALYIGQKGRCHSSPREQSDAMSALEDLSEATSIHLTISSYMPMKLEAGTCNSVDTARSGTAVPKLPPCYQERSTTRPLLIPRSIGCLIRCRIRILWSESQVGEMEYHCESPCMVSRHHEIIRCSQ